MDKIRKYMPQNGFFGWNAGKNKKNFSGNASLAIDFGSTSIKIVLGEKDESGSIRILGFGQFKSEGIEKGNIKNPKQASLSLKNALLTIFEEELLKHLDELDVFVGISGTYIKSTSICKEHIVSNLGGMLNVSSDYQERREICESDIEELRNSVMKEINHLGRKPIHAFAEKYYVDNNPEDVEEDIIGMEGRKISGKFNVVTAEWENIKRLEKVLLNNGLKVKRTVLQHLACADALLTKEEKEMGVVLVDIGAFTTNLIIYSKNMLKHVSILEFGSDHLNWDISNIFKITPTAAEQTKVNYASVIIEESDKRELIPTGGTSRNEVKEILKANLGMVVRERMLDLLKAIQIKLKTAEFDSGNIAQVILTGGGANLKGIKELFERALGISTRFVSPNCSIELHRDLPEEDFHHITSNEFSCALGLLKMILEEKSIDINSYEGYKKMTNEKYSGSMESGLWSPIMRKIDTLFNNTDVESYEEYR